jgi:serine/threonine-protein kinase
MADREPVVLNGRYELHSRIARGGMAEVFLARDQVLDRAVAVKVLFPEYAADPAFVERFRREAQSAANLNHPSIVGVYDWGSYHGTYFIVMEYVRGRSLAEVLRAEGTLHPDRAADVATDIAGALYFAHRNGVVHRDIKPGNVLLTPQGQVKVTDFGIARAVGGGNTDNLTQTGSVMGTATYFSPEQAQGLPVDPRSDLYSLGIVLYEMMCGRPPFSGDSPVAIDYQHVQGSATPPRQVNPDVPPALEAITLKLLAKNPANRYATAEELRADLRRFREGQPIAAESVLPGPVAVGVGAAGAMAMPAADATHVIAPTRVVARSGGNGTADPTAAGPVYAGAPMYEPPRRNGVFIAVLVVLLALLGVLLFFFARTVLGAGSNGSPEMVTVADVTGKPQAEAEVMLGRDGFQTLPAFEQNTQVDPGKVIRQDPLGLARAVKGSTVKLFISQPPQQLTVPNVTGQTEEAARAALVQAGFAQPRRTTRAVTDAKQKGVVVAQDPAAETKVNKDVVVTIEVGTGPGQVTLPSVSGQTVDDAQNVLIGAGIKPENIKQSKQPSDSVAADHVIGTDPAAATKVTTDSAVTILVSSGPDLVKVPGVVNLTQAAAERSLQGAGFGVEVTPMGLVNPNDPRIGKVMSQNPDGGSQAAKGSSVNIVVGIPADPTTTTGSSRNTTTTH